MQSRINNYIIQEELYASDTSIVYRCQDPETQSSRILKILNKDYPTNHELARFNYEYLVTQKAAANDIIRAYGLEPFERSLVMILEDIRGRDLLSQSLPDIQRDRPFTLNFLTISIKLAEALYHVHARQIIHMNLQPGNVIYNPENSELRLIDFGSASLLEQGKQNLSLHELPSQALPYISPEQTGRINRAVDYRTDIYSLGITLYELICGRLPFEADDPLGWVYCHTAKIPPSPSIIHAGIPEPLSKIILKCLNKDPEQRYQSLYGLTHDLRLCKVGLTRNATIQHFSLGSKDIIPRINFSLSMVGRDQEKETLLEQFRKTTRGANNLLMIYGPSGVGKTALVQELFESVITSRGYFITGKFDQFSSNSPYQAFILSFQDLIRQILSEPEDRFQEWKKRLKSLGPNIVLIIELVPEIEIIVGPQAPVPEMNPEETRNRFIATISNFIGLFAKNRHPLVIFLDDLQWADTGSFDLLMALSRNSDLNHFLLIGAYRDDELAEASPLKHFMETLNGRDTVIRLPLNPLDAEAATLMVSRCLHRSIEECLPLTRIIYHRTGGNPFYIKEIIKRLHQEGLILISHQHGKWTWDLEKIEAIDASPNIVAFILSRLNRISPDLKKTLHLASCIGNTFPLKTLAIIIEQSISKTAEQLWRLIQAGFILPLNNNYYLATLQQGQEDFNVSYKFLHDRIQQAAYSLADPAMARQIHLNIGRLLLENAKQHPQDPDLIETLRQLNKGRELMIDKDEIRHLTKLNLYIAKKAKSAAAYQSSFDYLAIAKSLLVSDALRSDYQFSFEVLKEFTESAYLCGKLDIAETQADILYQAAASNLAKAEIRYLQALQYLSLGKLKKTIKAGIQGLILMGIRLKEHTGVTPVVVNMLKVKLAIGKKDIASLAAMPVVEDKQLSLIIKFFRILAFAANITGNRNLFCLCILKGVQLTLKHGNSPESAICYLAYGIFLTILGNYARANEFGKLAIAMNRSLQDIQYRAVIHYSYASNIQDWLETTPEAMKTIHKAIEAGYQSGDLITVSFALVYQLRVVIENDLLKANDMADQFMDKVDVTTNEPARNNILLFRQYVHNLMGLTRSRDCLDDDSFSESEFKASDNESSQLLIVSYHLRKWELAIIYQDHVTAAFHMELVLPDAKKFAGRSRVMALIYLLSFLTLSRQYVDMNRFDQFRARKKMARITRWMNRVADLCPANYFHLLRLIQAETQKLINNPQKAATCYEQAMAAAQKNHFLFHEALCTESAARFFRATGQKERGRVLLKEARYLYQRWGASEKVKQLDEAGYD